MYWYVEGKSQSGHPFFAGPLTEVDANKIGMNNCGANFELYDLDTRDPNRARKQINFMRNQKGVPLQDVFQRHEVYHPEQKPPNSPQSGGIAGEF